MIFHPTVLRVLRFWLVFFVPAAVYFAWQAHESNQFTGYFEMRGKDWLQKQAERDKGGLRGMFDAREVAAESFRSAAMSRENRDRQAAIAAALLVAPWLALLGWRVTRWTWSGK